MLSESFRFGSAAMGESISQYHRRRAAEEKSEADLHAGDITAQRHRRLALQHRALAKEAEDAERGPPEKSRT
jgi:hypothetical protein